MKKTCCLVVCAILLAAVSSQAAATRSIGVAPFANAAPIANAAPLANAARGDALPPDLAVLLAAELDRLSSARIVAPDALQLEGDVVGDPGAREVRRWAEEHSLDELVIGRVDASGRGATVELRSGHSGASRAEYQLQPEPGAAEGAAVARLARLILADLGESATTVADTLPSVSAAAVAAQTESSPAAEQTSSANAKETPEDEDGLSLLPGVSRDDPISINSDELEVLPEGGGRRLVFSRNVEVQQGAITLEADRLEAIYPQGASQPDRLYASGRVRVFHGDRRGRCEEATYERVANTIVCRGKAQVIQGCDQVRGESIEFDLTHESVRVVGAASVVIHPDESGDGCAADLGAAR